MEEESVSLLGLVTVLGRVLLTVIETVEVVGTLRMAVEVLLDVGTERHLHAEESAVPST